MRMPPRTRCVRFWPPSQGSAVIGDTHGYSRRMSDLDSVEVRVLGCLLEKQQTTPDAYPLTLNALRLACNQTTNRSPVVEYELPQIRDALHRLGHRRWTRLASGASSRAPKYRHLLDEAIGLRADEQAVLGVLLLRGPQTLGELKQRTERMHRFADLQAVSDVLDRLAERSLGRWLNRQPGQKEARFEQTLGGRRAYGVGSRQSGVGRFRRETADRELCRLRTADCRLSPSSTTFASATTNATRRTSSSTRTTSRTSTSRSPSCGGRPSAPTTRCSRRAPT